MAFTGEEFRDLVRLLEQRPEWRTELRRILLTDELLALPQAVTALVEGLQTLTQRVDRLETVVTALAEGLHTLTQRVDALTTRVDALTTRVDVLTAQMTTLTTEVGALATQMTTLTREVGALATQMTTLTTEVGTLAAQVGTLVTEVGTLKGYGLERRYREHAAAYFGDVVRRAHLLTEEELATLLDEAVEQGRLSRWEVREVTLADLVVRGRRWDDGAQVYLVVEVSWGVGPSDVERAAMRAGWLSKAGVLALPVVAGREMLPAARGLARDLKVWLVTDGRVISPNAET